MWTCDNHPVCLSERQIGNIKKKALFISQRFPFHLLNVTVELKEKKDQTRAVLEFFPLKGASLSLSVGSLDLIPQERVCQTYQHRRFLKTLHLETA